MPGEPGQFHFTERMEPETANARVFWEHLYRYRFAKDFVPGKTVLDIACGEGYGASALVKAGASQVIGVDISGEACERARERYHLDARVGDAEDIPLEDRSRDVVVSFETIEHVPNPPGFVRECYRVLAPGGTLIVSTPNRPVYSDDHPPNPFHMTEFDENEFRDLLLTHFQSVRMCTQVPRTVAWWSVRSLCAERSPWLRIRGFWRFSAWLCPTIRNHVDPALRQSADQLILGKDTALASCFNPFVVRPRSPSTNERPYILIAVAHKA